MSAIEIKHRFSGDVIFMSLSAQSVREAVEDAVKQGVSLAGADLSNANLPYANLPYADLSHANLSRADLSGVNLSRANLSNANLSYANLPYADLLYADLSYADLLYADLSHANLSCADLSHADLSHADLSHANLSCADLSYVNIRGTVGDGRRVKSLQIGAYAIAYTSDLLQIGCQKRPISEWLEFDEDEIAYLDGERAVRFWRKHREWLAALVTSLSPAEPQ